MSIKISRAAIGAAVLSLTLTPAWAQQGGHQMAGMATGSGGGAAMCAQNSEGVTRTIDVVNGRIEDARQTNDASRLRASIADLQVVLAQMKTQLADCVSLAAEAGGGTTGTMPGMDHSKMPMAPGTPVMQPGSPSPAPGAAGGGTTMPGMDHSKMAGVDHSKMAGAPKSAHASGSGGSATGAKEAAPATGMDHSKMGASSAKANPAEPSKMAGMDHSKMTGSATAARPPAGTHGSATPAAAVVFTVRTDPAPPRSGKNDFEITLKDAEGKPIADAEVSLAFYMPAMPSMNMPEMRAAAQLASAGNGVYKGSGTMGMAGDWDVTVTAARKGQTLGARKIKLTAK